MPTTIFSYTRQQQDQAARRARINELAEKVDKGQISVLDFTRTVQHILDERRFSWTVFWSIFFRTNRSILIVYFIVVAMMCLIPPWKSYLDGKGFSQSVPQGYSFIMTPPKPREPELSVLVDKERLNLQFLGLTALALGAIFAVDLFGTKQKSSGSQ